MKKRPERRKLFAKGRFSEIVPCELFAKAAFCELHFKFGAPHRPNFVGGIFPHISSLFEKASAHESAAACRSAIRHTDLHQKKRGNLSLVFFCPSAVPSAQGLLSLPVWIQHIRIALHRWHLRESCPRSDDPSRLRRRKVLHSHQHTNVRVPQDVQASGSIGAAPFPRRIPDRPVLRQQFTLLSW